ncbi:uncharacterized protein MONOS_18636 [Monocercomonoides exilis]|uniref:uncharacterized protein n=1 Tax=Monocercomonoides exilis TaxID=2049356 RepID=UPI0035596596|nr:hypothetical protein MONOS_18636 [Monocercomonoides exilis]
MFKTQKAFHMWMIKNLNYLSNSLKTPSTVQSSLPSTPLPLLSLPSTHLSSIKHALYQMMLWIMWERNLKERNLED